MDAFTYIPPKQDVSLRGENTGALPNKGTSTGVTDTYGADLSGEAKNVRGKVNDTQSNSPEARPGSNPFKI